MTAARFSPCDASRYSGHQRRGEGQDTDGEQQEQVEHQDGVINADQALEHCVVVDPDDADREERDHVGGVIRPLLAEAVSQRAGPGRIGHVEIEGQQRDRHRNDGV
jgi:hypothetical protein